MWASLDFNPIVSSVKFHSNVTFRVVLSPGCNSLSFKLVVTALSPSKVHVPSSTNLNPAGAKSSISVAKPAISPIFFILSPYELLWNL